MIDGCRVLAIVPARSGSKGLPDKNLHQLGEHSLLAWAARCAAGLPWLDERLLSTDSERYAAEGRRFGLRAPFLRPSDLATDDSPVLATVRHALRFCEEESGRELDVVLLLEPSSPFRRLRDVEAVVRAVAGDGAPAALAVSPLDSKNHPLKVFQLDERARISLFDERGRDVTRRQSLSPLYQRNGVAYAWSRETVLGEGTPWPDGTVAHLVDGPVANVDHPLDFAWAEFLLEKDLVDLDWNRHD